MDEKPRNKTEWVILYRGGHLMLLQASQQKAKDKAVWHCWEGDPEWTRADKPLGSSARPRGIQGPSLAPSPAAPFQSPAIPGTLAKQLAAQLSSNNKANQYGQKTTNNPKGETAKSQGVYAFDPDDI